MKKLMYVGWSGASRTGEKFKKHSLSGTNKTNMSKAEQILSETDGIKVSLTDNTNYSMVKK